MSAEEAMRKIWEITRSEINRHLDPEEGDYKGIVEHVERIMGGSRMMEAELRDRGIMGGNYADGG